MGLLPETYLLRYAQRYTKRKNAIFSNYDLTTKQFRKAFELGQSMRTETAQESATPRPAARYGVWSSIEDVTIDGVTYKAAKPSQIVPPLGATLHTLSKLFKTDIRLYASEADKSGKYSGRNGFYKDGVIYVDINAHANSTAEKSAVLLTIAHELTHELRESNEAGYRELRDFVIEHMVRSGTDIEQLAREKISESGNPNMSIDDAVEEIVCNASERMLLNTKYAELMEKEKPNLFDAIRKWLSGLRDRIQKIFEGEGYSKENAYKEAKILWDVMDEMQEIWDRAMVQAQSSRLDGRQQNESGTESGSESGTGTDVKSSIRPEFAEEVQNWYDSSSENSRSTAGGYFKIGRTSDVLKRLGARDDSIYWRKYKIGTILEEHPAIDINVIKQVPEILESPTLVMKSRTVADSIVIFGNVNAINGERVMAALELTPIPAGGAEAEFSLISSAYNRSETSIKNLIENSEILFVNKKEAKAWSKSLGVQFPSDQPNLDYVGRITYNGKNVNISGKTLKELGGVVSQVKASERQEQDTEDVKTAEKYFGTTYKISEAGYLLTDGKLLDFSGRHEGGSGGYRSVDHRDITDAFDGEYGDGGYSDGMVKFMQAGNIRLSPESGGINLSVKPNAKQIDTLDRYIANFRGEVMLDIDNANGDTVVSIEYPKRTYSKRIINDINAYFDNGTIPEQPSDLGQFRYSSREMRDTAEEAKGREESAAVLRRENRILRERIEYWKKQSRVTKEYTLRNTDTLEYARELVKRLDSAATSAEVNQGLQEMGAYLLNAENVDWDMLWEHALTLAHSISDDADIVISDEMKAEREDFESFLKSVPVDVAPLVKAGEISYSDLKGYPIVHRKNGTTVDDLYQQLQERFGEGIFPDVPDGGDMIDNIKRYADAEVLTKKMHKVIIDEVIFYLDVLLPDKMSILPGSVPSGKAAEISAEGVFHEKYKREDSQRLCRGFADRGRRGGWACSRGVVFVSGGYAQQRRICFTGI